MVALKGCTNIAKGLGGRIIRYSMLNVYGQVDTQPSMDLLAQPDLLMAFTKTPAATSAWADFDSKPAELSHLRQVRMAVA